MLLRGGDTFSRGDIFSLVGVSGGTFVPRNECPEGHFFQGDSHSSDTGSATPTAVVAGRGRQYITS